METTELLPLALAQTDVLPNYLLKRVKLINLELQLLILVKDLIQVESLRYLLPSKYHCHKSQQPNLYSLGKSRFPSQFLEKFLIVRFYYIIHLQHYLEYLTAMQCST